MQLKVAIDDVVHEVEVKAVDVVAFERKFQLDYSAVKDNPRIEYVYFLAWNACRRLKLTDLDFDTWLDSAPDVESSADPKAKASARSKRAS